MNRIVIIDSFPESAKQYRDGYAIVVVDVIRATTTATTALSFGRRVFPVKTSDDAFVLSNGMKNALLIGELGGHVPYGFHFTNSPVLMTALTMIPTGDFANIKRPIILLSSSGTQLLMNAVGAQAIYLACFRNVSAVARHMAAMHERIAVLGAGTRGQFRREDQMACAWVAGKLIEAGYKPETKATEQIITRWKGGHPQIVRKGRSAKYLMESGQIMDLEFILTHIDDLDVVPQLIDNELVIAPGT